MNPKELFKVGDTGFRILWEDGHRSNYQARQLRLECPCASCSDEWTGQRLLAPTMVSADIKLQEARLVGNYAVQFLFSDGHGTGIFSFENLRRLCPCEACGSPGG